MTLENNQIRQNQVIAAIGNNSESNDPSQFKHSTNNALIASAERFAAGKTLGLSEEETLALREKLLTADELDVIGRLEALAAALRDDLTQPKAPAAAKKNL